MNLRLLRSGKLWLGLLGTALFLGLFFASTDPSELADALAEANYWWLAPALAIWFVSAWFRSLRWHYLLRPLGGPTANALYPIVIIGYMANNLLPARTGELVRAYILGERHRISKLSALGTIAVDRLFDVLVLVLFLALVGAFLGLEDSLRFLVIAMAGAFLVTFLLFFWATSAPQRAEGLVDLLLHLVPARFRAASRQWASAFIEGLASLQNRRIMAAVLVASTVAWLLEATVYYLVGLSFDLNEGFPTFLLLAGAGNLAVAAPSTSGGLGPFEWASQVTLTSVGVASGTASAYTLALHGLLLFPIIAAGLGCLWAINLSLVRVIQRPGPPARMPAPEPVE